MTSPSDRPERKAREALPRSKGRCAPGESIFQLLGSRWDRLWYVSPRRTAQEVRAVLAAAEGALGAPLPEGARVLDIGCGTGRHALALARRGFVVTGVDLAPAMLRAAAAKARGARLKGRLALVRGDACRLPVRAGRFDLAISLCQGAFGEPARPAGDRRLLAEARRALRPGGALVLVALDRSWLDRQGDWRYDPARGKNVGREWHTLEDGRRRKVEMSTRAYSPLEAASLLERAGFALAGAAGAEPGAYEEHPLDGTAMQYMIAALAPKKSRVKAKRRPARKVTNAPRAR